MTTETEDQNLKSRTLGRYLASIRNDRKMSLRQVEEASNKEVSNAYLSQIENDKIKQPSPNILNSLADIYRIKFEYLMQIAGYITPTSESISGDRHGRVATFAEHNLSSDEETELMEYLQFIRKRNKKRDKT